MTDYYEIHEGHLQEGEIAYASDIMSNLKAIQDAFQNVIKDFTEGQAWILGTNDQSDKDAFILTPESKRNGRYIDQMNIANGDDVDLVSIRQTSYRQPIRISRSSIYSIIVSMQNKSEKSVPVSFELRDDQGDLIPGMKSVVTVPSETKEPQEFEVIFDLDYYPTAHGIEPEELEDGDTDLANDKEGEESAVDVESDTDDEEDLASSTAGASVIYLYVDALNKNKQEAFDVNTKQDNGYAWNDTDPTFGIVINKNSTYGSGLEENNGSGFVKASKGGDLAFKEVFANSPAYKCTVGQAIVNGKKVMLADTHVCVSGGSSFGDVISRIYMDDEGHLHSANSEPFTGDEPATPIEVTESHLHIADITTYANDVNNPVISQSDETQVTRPRSHHERLRRLENKTRYLEDISVPPRFKYVLTGEDWIDTNPHVDLTSRSYNGLQAQELDSLKSGEYTITTDSKGEFIIKASKAKTFSIPVGLDEVTQKIIDAMKLDSAGLKKLKKSVTVIKESKDLAEHDLTRAKIFEKVKNLAIDYEKKRITLKNDTDTGVIVASNKKEAKLTEFNPWDDSKSNRPSSSKVKPITRSYTVVSGKNGSRDYASEYPAMTLYTDGCHLKKLQIPIHKFKNCDGMQFFLWKRQGPNNKKNTVWLKKPRIFKSKVQSLKNAKKKKGYQILEDGIMLDFGKKGLKLKKGQYVLVCLPIVKSGKGTVYVDTYKPKNSKDFCIRYYGASNASHFLLKDRYQEVWYNPAKAQMMDTNYDTEGELESSVIKWENEEPIKSIKPSMNITTPDHTKAALYADVGGGWKKLKLNEENDMTGSGSGETFKWKLVMKGNSKETPTIKYSKKKKYAINFEITRSAPQTQNQEAFNTLDKNLCLTSKLIDANNILRQYLGDMNFALTDSKFSNYEFARIWAQDESKDKLNIDIFGSDYLAEVKQGTDSQTYTNVTDKDGNQLYYPVYSFHYVDVKLEDIPRISTDYSNYDPTLEDDEYNLRFKLDTENSYNDSDIRIIDPNGFELAKKEYAVDDNTNTDNTNDSSSSSSSGTGSNTNDSGSSGNSSSSSSSDSSTSSDSSDSSGNLQINLTKISTAQSDGATTSNQLLAVNRLSSPVDFTKYGGIQIAIKLNGSNDATVSGLALYLSSQNEVEVPNEKVPDDYLSAMEDGLPDLNLSQEEIIKKYANKVVYDKVIYNGTEVKVYYKSIWDSKTEEWGWQQIHDVKPYNIYKFIDRKEKSSTFKITSDNNGEEQYLEFEIDPNDSKLQYVKEIGIIALNDEKEYSNSGDVTSLEIVDFKVIKNDYYDAFNASKGDVFETAMPANRNGDVVCAAHEKLHVVYDERQDKYYTKTTPPTSSIQIKHQRVNDETLCTFDMTSKSTKNFNFIGIQLATDCLLTKHMLELHLKKVDSKGVETTIDKIQLPTTNYIYYPKTDSRDKVNLVQIIKKIKTTERFDKICLVATPKWMEYSGKLKNVTTEHPEGTLGEYITLYVGNIRLYRAKTMPFFYPYMRMKFYLDDADEVSREKIGIRKIGAIIQYQ